ncbi:MAG: hypothetical protein J5449_10540 [Oscillospiraceae bacterium]|nr:hypothetical protein [Oscillospiraceae bacterium]
MSDINRVITMLCEKRNIATTAFCKRFRIPYDLFCQLDKNDSAYLTADSVKRIAAFFGVSPSYLYGYDKESKHDLKEHYHIASQISTGPSKSSLDAGEVSAKKRESLQQRNNTYLHDASKKVSHPSESKISAQNTALQDENIHIPLDSYDDLNTYSVCETESGKLMIILQRRYELLELLKIAVDMSPEQVAALIDFLKEVTV